jgi:hypothetical protein
MLYERDTLQLHIIEMRGALWDFLDLCTGYSRKHFEHPRRWGACGCNKQWKIGKVTTALLHLYCPSLCKNDDCHILHGAAYTAPGLLHIQ